MNTGAAEARWERIAHGTKWLGILMLAVAGYDLWDGDDWRGVVMSVAPAAVLLAMWRLAVARLDQLESGEDGGRLRWVATGALVVVGGAAIGLVVLNVGGAVERQDQVDRRAAEVDEPVVWRAPADLDVEEREVQMADGTVQRIPMLVRRPTAASAIGSDPPQPPQ
jgi:hypothetical protein